MRGRTMDIGCRSSLVAMTTAVLFGCGPSPITSIRIEDAIAPTFGNLIQVQLSWLGQSSVAASDITVTASCRKLGVGNAGAGEWACTVAWQTPNRGTLRESYDLSVATDGCYTAIVAGENLGGPTLKGPDDSDVRNLLYTFEGCFDTT